MSVSASGGFLAIGTGNGVLQAHDALDGAERWKFETTHPFGGSGLVQVGGTIVAAARDGYVYVLHASNGSVRREIVLPGINQTFEGTQLRTASASTAVALQYGKRIFVLDPVEGTILWDYTLAADTYQGWVAAVGASHVYIVEQKFTDPITWLTSAHAVRDGTVQWSTIHHGALEPAWDAASSLVEVDDTVYAYGFGLHAVERQTGSLLWDQKAIPQFHVAKVAVGRAVVLVGVRDYAGAFRRENGAPLWSITGRRGAQNYFEEFSSLLLLNTHSEEVVYIGRYEANPHGFLVEAREPETGNLRWVWRGDSSLLHPTWRFRGAAGMLYVPTYDKVHAVRAADGQEIWQIPIERESSTAFLAASDGTP